MVKDVIRFSIAIPYPCDYVRLVYDFTDGKEFTRATFYYKGNVVNG